MKGEAASGPERAAGHDPKLMTTSAKTIGLSERWPVVWGHLQQSARRAAGVAIRSCRHTM